MKIDLAAPRSRRVVRRTTHRVVGRFPSLKSGRMIHWESQLERDMARLLEFDPNVLSYAEQPEPLHYVEDGKNRKYTPDFVVETRGGFMVIEVKPADQASIEPWKSRLALFEQHYREYGVSYCVMTDTEIRQEPRLANVTTFLRYQRLEIPEHIQSLIISQLKSHPTTIDDLCGSLAPHHLNRSHIYALVSRGLLSVNVNEPLGPDTAVHLRQGGMP